MRIRIAALATAVFLGGISMAGLALRRDSAAATRQATAQGQATTTHVQRATTHVQPATTPVQGGEDDEQD